MICPRGFSGRAFIQERRPRIFNIFEARVQKRILPRQVFSDYQTIYFIDSFK
jgi:hypothetical protein